MPHREDIVGGYRTGSTTERLELYLAHPALRERFDGIEREEERRFLPGTPAEYGSRFRGCVDRCCPGGTGSGRRRAAEAPRVPAA